VHAKWTYEILDDGKRVSYSPTFFEQIGLGDLLERDACKIGTHIVEPGTAIGSGLTNETATELGLKPNTPVGAGLIDAYAGTLGCLGCKVDGTDEINALPLTARISIICGTSTCYMSVTEKAYYVPGIAGPFYSVMLPNLWMHEPGQSATGKLLDHIVDNHVAYSWVKAEADKKNVHPHIILNEILEFMSKRDEVSPLAKLTSDLHIWPDFHGNRSPLADPTTRGMVCGLTLGSGAEDLARLYLAAVQSLAYGIRHIMSTMQNHGQDSRVLHMCGGLVKNRLYVQAHADATGLPVVLPHTSEAVLLGSAMLGACASGHSGGMLDVLKKMGGTGDVMPDESTREYHDKKYKVFMEMLKNQRAYKDIMLS